MITRDEKSVYWKSVVWGFKPDLRFWNAGMDTFQEPSEADVIFFPLYLEKVENFLVSICANMEMDDWLFIWTPEEREDWEERRT